MTNTETMKHLGNVLSLLAELRPQDRCKALDNALEFYNRENPSNMIEPTEGYMTALCSHGPLGTRCWGENG